MGGRHATDLAGKVFGRLTVVYRAGSKGCYAQWFCKCSCGGTKTATGSSLVRGYTRSCGCLRSEAFRETLRLGRERKKLGRSYNPALGTPSVRVSKFEERRKLPAPTWEGAAPAALDLASVFGYATAAAPVAPPSRVHHVALPAEAAEDCAKST